MRAVGLYGSPRPKGNTAQLLDEFLKGCEEQGAEIQKVYLAKFKITPCRACYTCMKTGRCCIRDEMTSLYDKLEKADIIVLGSPIFFYGLPAQIKALIDRCQVFWARKYILKDKFKDSKISAKGGSASGEQGFKRRGFFISTAATRGKKVFDGAVLTMRYFFDALDIEYRGDLLVRLYAQKDEVRRHPTALKEAYEAGRKLMENDLCSTPKK